jgi:tetratricopeptide (TPR) repeat protein
MEIEKKYKTAVELASTGRYREALTLLSDILQKQPNHIEALVLSGKVHYYLKQFPDSRRCFETVLTYDPGNFAAFFGLEYYNERKRRIGFYAAFFLISFFLVTSAVLLYINLNRSFESKIFHLEDSFSKKIGVFDRSLKEYSHSRIKKNEELFLHVRELSKMISEDLKRIFPILKNMNDSIKNMKLLIFELKKKQDRFEKNVKLPGENSERESKEF